MGNVGYGFYAQSGSEGGYIRGIISDVYMGAVSNHGFYANGNISGTISNVTMLNVSTASFAAVNNITSKISYVKSNGNIIAGTFSGQLLDCEFDLRGKTTTIITTLSSDAIIERCKLLTDTGVDTITAASPNTPVQILYTVINNGTLNISATPSTNNYNISTW